MSHGREKTEKRIDASFLNLEDEALPTYAFRAPPLTLVFLLSPHLPPAASSIKSAEFDAKRSKQATYRAMLDEQTGFVPAPSPDRILLRKSKVEQSDTEVWKTTLKDRPW